MQDLNVTLIQTKQFWEDKQKNLTYFETQFLSKIKPNTTDLILLPEMFNTSFSMQPKKLAEDMKGTSINWLVKWATQLKTTIGTSLIIQEGANYYNRFVVISEKGVEDFYDKRHLFRMANEDAFFSAGKNRVVLQLKGWKLLLQVCYDLRFPVFSRNRKINNEKEYDAIIYIANWPEQRNKIWNNLLVTRAIENQAYVIGVNRVGQDGNEINYTGDSQLIDPWGNITYKLPPRKEGLIIGELSRTVLDKIKTTFPSYLDGDDFKLI